MATNGEIPSGDAEMAECDGEEVVTMMDVLKEQQEFEDDANAVLGGSDEKECTYSQGYIKRQAIYACMTCCPESKDDPLKRAGFCLACSLSCHENHDLVELYTKRNFRCDCGNPKFKSPCQFTPNKTELNTDNVYNQNFVGLYCSCSKPYGDPETTLDDEMIQCIICEDWWHATHLDAVVPAPDQYSEMICKLCMAKNEFLHDYSDLAVNVESVDVDVVKVNGVDNIETDKLTNNGTVTEEKLANGTDEKLTNSIESSVENETSKTTNEAEESSGKESLKEQVENKTVEPKKPEENKPDVPMDTEEPDKTTKDTLEDKTETSPDQEDNSAPSEKTADSNTESEKTEDAKNPDEINEANEPSEEKAEESSSTDNNMEDTSASVDKTTEAKEAADNAESSPTKTTSEHPTENDECSAQATSETNAENDTVTEKSSENVDTNESNTTEKGIDSESLKNEGTSVETDKSSAADEVNDKTNDEVNNKITNEAKATITSQDEEMKDSKDVEIEAKEISENDTSKQNVDAKDENTNSIDGNNTVPELVSTDKKRKIDDVDNISVKKPKLDDNKCLRPKGVKKIHNGATFWPSTFRQKLCTCNECIEMYKDLSVLFLTDVDDTVYAYETLGKERTAGKLNQYEKGMEALCSLGRIQQIDALTEYNKMRDKLLTFLQSFKDKKEIVTEHDIKTFFAGMKPEKHTDGVYFCR